MILSGMLPFLNIKPWPAEMLKLPRIQAHRGLWSDKVRENSLEAFIEAQKAGILMSECDVQISKDEVPVVYHDFNLKRLHHREDLVCDLTSGELAEIGIPALEDVLLHPEGTASYNIEIKNLSIAGTPLERRISEVVRKTNSATKVVFSSFNPFSLHLLEKLIPEVPRCFLWSQKSSQEHLFKPEWLLAMVSVHGLNLDYKGVSLEVINELKRRHIPLSLWTVNSQDEINWYLNNGVDSIITDSGAHHD